MREREKEREVGIGRVPEVEQDIVKIIIIIIMQIYIAHTMKFLAYNS